MKNLGDAVGAALVAALLPPKRAPTTMAFTPVFDGLRGAPTVERPSGSRRPHQAKVETLVILLVDADMKKPGAVSRPGTLREFQFPE
jgi:hypothetical protein